MQTVKLVGQIEQFGSVWHTDCSNIRDIFRLIECQTPGFRQYLIDAAEAGVGFEIQRGSDFLEYPEELFLSLNNEDIIITEVPAGAKSGAAKILAAVAIMTVVVFAPHIAAGGLQGLSATIAQSGLGATMQAGFYASGTAGLIATGVATNLALSGLSQILSPGPEVDGQQENEAYLFDGPVTNTAQGIPVPVAYGELRVGGAVISTEYSSASPYNSFGDFDSIDYGDGTWTNTDDAGNPLEDGADGNIREETFGGDDLELEISSDKPEGVLEGDTVTFTIVARNVEWSYDPRNPENVMPLRSSYLIMGVQEADIGIPLNTNSYETLVTIPPNGATVEVPILTDATAEGETLIFQVGAVAGSQGQKYWSISVPIIDSQQSPDETLILETDPISAGGVGGVVQGSEFDFVLKGKHYADQTTVNYELSAEDEDGTAVTVNTTNFGQSSTGSFTLNLEENTPDSRDAITISVKDDIADNGKDIILTCTLTDANANGLSDSVTIKKQSAQDSTDSGVASISVYPVALSDGIVANDDLYTFIVKSEQNIAIGSQIAFTLSSSDSNGDSLTATELGVDTLSGNIEVRAAGQAQLRLSGSYIKDYIDTNSVSYVKVTLKLTDYGVEKTVIFNASAVSQVFSLSTDPTTAASQGIEAGNSFDIKLNTTGVSDSTQVAYTLAATDSTGSSVTVNNTNFGISSSGNFTVTGGEDSITITPSATLCDAANVDFVTLKINLTGKSQELTATIKEPVPEAVPTPSVKSITFDPASDAQGQIEGGDFDLIITTENFTSTDKLFITVSGKVGTNTLAAADLGLSSLLFTNQTVTNNQYTLSLSPTSTALQSNISVTFTIQGAGGASGAFSTAQETVRLVPTPTKNFTLKVEPEGNESLQAGSSFKFLLETEGVSDNTTVPYEISFVLKDGETKTLAASDIGLSSLSGNFTVQDHKAELEITTPSTLADDVSYVDIVMKLTQTNYIQTQVKQITPPPANVDEDGSVLDTEYVYDSEVETKTKLVELPLGDNYSIFWNGDTIVDRQSYTDPLPTQFEHTYNGSTYIYERNGTPEQDSFYAKEYAIRRLANDNGNIDGTIGSGPDLGGDTNPDIKYSLTAPQYYWQRDTANDEFRIYWNGTLVTGYIADDGTSEGAEFYTTETHRYTRHTKQITVGNIEYYGISREEVTEGGDDGHETTPTPNAPSFTKDNSGNFNPVDGG